MATNDLCNELQKDIKIDENMEKRICAAVLKQLDDQSNDVQSVAVKCLAIILKKVQQTQIGEICDKLCSLILDGKDALRDIYSIGLKTLIADVPDEMGPLVSDRLSGRLLNGITRTGPDDIKRECLDNMADLLRRFGHLISKDHEDVMNAVVHQLDHEKSPLIRKRAAVCLGALAVCSSDSLLNRLVELILEQIEIAERKGKGKGSAAASSSGNGHSSQAADTRTLIQTVGTISRTVGYRLGRHLDRLVPLFLRFCGEPDDENPQNETANELREHCLPGLESFVLRCPKEVSPYIGSILKAALGFMKYDPNYSYDCDDDADAMDEERDEDDEEEAFDDEGFGSDDDDTSWKVRKAAVRVISAVIAARPETPSLQELFEACADELVNRFKEREENVRLDVLACFTALLQAVLSNSGHRPSTQPSTFVSSGSMSPTRKGTVTSAGRGSIAASTLVHARMGKIVGAALKQLQGPATQVKTKSMVFSMLRTLVTVMPGGLQDQMPALLGSVEKCIAEKDQTLKLDALLFLRLALETQPPHALQSSLARLLPLVVAAVHEDWYKIIAEALRVLGALVQVARPRDEVDPSMFAGNYDYAPLVLPVYHAVLPRMEALDIDQEIKECAITAVGKLFSHFGDALKQQLPVVLGLLRKRLDNEITRLPTLKALAVIASSPLNLDLSSVLLNSTVELSLFLRQQSRGLKQTALQTLDALVLSPSAQLDAQAVGVILHEAAALVNDADLHLTHLALRLALSVMAKFRAHAESIRTEIYPKAIELSSSPLLQGLARSTLVSFLQELVDAGYSGMSFPDVLEALYSRSTSPSSGGEMAKQSVGNVAKCVAGICARASAVDRHTTVQRFAADLQQAVDEKRRHLALLCIGELGQQSDLSLGSSGSAEGAQLKDLILACFESGSEETKAAAAYALGRLAVGSMVAFLPVVLQAVESNKQQYLLLASLKEIILVHANQGLDFAPYLDSVLPGLLRQCQADEDGVRSAVSECLGALTSMHGARLVPVLLQVLASSPSTPPSADEAEADKGGRLARWTIATALRFALSRQSSGAMSSSLQSVAPSMGSFLCMLQDSDLEVRKAALLMANAAAHHNPDVIAPYLVPQVMPQLLETLTFKQERVVDLGPFKHKVDDGLPLRKAALTCLETVLDTLPECLDVGAFMARLVSVLSDKDEVKLQGHHILCKLCAYAPGAVLGSADALIDPLEKTVTKKASKEGLVGPEAERALELIRSGLRAVLVVNRVEDMAQNRRWSDFVDRLSRRDAPTAELLDALTVAHDRGAEI